LAKGKRIVGLEENTVQHQKHDVDQKWYRLQHVYVDLLVAPVKIIYLAQVIVFEELGMEPLFLQETFPEDTAKK